MNIVWITVCSVTRANIIIDTVPTGGREQGAYIMLQITEFSGDYWHL